MKRLSLLTAGTCLLPALAPAQALDDPATSRHHFGVNIPVWLNARGKITAVRATNPGLAPGAPATLADGRVDRNYDDGYNRVNTPGNPALGPGGTPVTTYFGYQNVSQVANVVGAGTLTEHSVQLNGGDYNRSMKNQAFPGLEFAYQYDWKSGKDWRLSWDASVGYQWFNWSHRDAPNSTANVITDVYQLNGVNLPGASYDGSPTPSPFTATIGSTPTRTDATALASVTGSRQLGLHALQLRLAPAVEWAPTPDWLLGASAGVTLGLGFTELSYAETINTVDGAGNPLSISQSGRSTATHVWAGLSTAVRVTRHLGEHWDVQLEARHLLVDPIHHNAPVRSGEIHLSDGLSLAAALSYRF